jgi:hypothetical protein
MSQEERRSEPRYLIRQAASVRIPEHNPQEIATTTENMSAHGVALRCSSSIPLHSKVRVTWFLPDGPSVKGAGQVLRVEQPVANESFLISVRCDVPFKISHSSATGTRSADPTSSTMPKSASRTFRLQERRAPRKRVREQVSPTGKRQS